MPPRRKGRAGRAARRPLSILPPETIVHIVKLSAPELSNDRPSTVDESSERFAHFRTCALVSPSWRPLAQAELFKSVHLAGKKCPLILVKLFVTRRGTELAGLVQTIRVEGEWGLLNINFEPNTLWDIFRHCHALKHVSTNPNPTLLTFRRSCLAKIIPKARMQNENLRSQDDTVTAGHGTATCTPFCEFKHM